MRILLLATILLVGVNFVFAQNDSVILKNRNTVVGEIKSLDKSVLTIETSYSKSDFTIKWLQVKELYSNKRFLVTLKDGQRINGTIFYNKDNNKVVLNDSTGLEIVAGLEEIVNVVSLASDFWSRITASIDLGLSFTKAHNLKQITVRSAVGYLADRWRVDASYNGIHSTQDSVATTKRIEAILAFRYFLQKDWFLAGSINFLSNTEQGLRLRTMSKLGAGKYLKHSNRSHWGVGGGISFNNESFTNEESSRNSIEGYVGTELDIYDIGDLNLLTRAYVYPSFTESGRWRSDISFDSKYKFPKDFYVKLGLTLNYDNQPAISGRNLDYVFLFTIGWEFN